MKTLKSAIVALVVATAMAGAAPTAAVAQEADARVPEARNAVYLELFGNGLLYSVNYDRRFTDAAGVRLGIGAVGGAGAVPATFNYLMGGDDHHFELGIGGVLVYAPGELDENGDLVEDADTEAVVLGTGTIGYRFQPNDGGFVFRIGLTPIFSTSGLLPWAGLSFGYSF